MNTVSSTAFLSLLGVLVHGQSYYGTNSAAGGACSGTKYLIPRGFNQTFTDGPASASYPNNLQCQWVITKNPAAILSTSTSSGMGSSYGSTNYNSYNWHGSTNSAQQSSTNSAQQSSTSGAMKAQEVAIRLWFSRFDVESCCDHVKIFTYNPDKGYFDSEVPRASFMEVTTTALLVKFTTDGSVQYTGFEAMFNKYECGAGNYLGTNRNMFMLETGYKFAPQQDLLRTREECSAAAARLGLSDTTASDDGQRSVSFDPPGCYFEGGSLKFNSDLSNTGRCTTSDNCVLRGVGRGCNACPNGTMSAADAPYISGCDTCAAGYHVGRPLPGFMQTSGSCTHVITTIDECTRTARYLNLSVTAQDDGQNQVSYDPPGCYYEGNQLKFNADLTNTGPCTGYDVSAVVSFVNAAAMASARRLKARVHLL
eukprot:g605.t1